MPDAIFAHPRLAPLYDTFDGERTDLASYLRIVDEFGGRQVLDVGCGTGSLAVLLAGHGIRVIAVDPAEASLRVARSKPGAHAVAWVHGDALSLPPLCVDFAVMTGNVAQVFLTDRDWSAALAGIRSALRDDGYFVFETRRPEYRAWEKWTARPGPVVREIPGVGRVEQRLVVTNIDLPYVSFRYVYTFDADGCVVASESTLRFRGAAEVESDLAANGFAGVSVRDAPDRPGREYVFIARWTRPS